jgi:hypothetical protein
MPDLLPDTWTWREYPVLCRVVALCDPRPRAWVDIDHICEGLDLERRDVELALLALESDGYFETYTDGGMTVSGVGNLHPDARRATGTWPTPASAFDRIIAALEELAENSEDEDTRTRARKFLDGALGAGRTVGLAVTAAAISGQIPGAGS